MSVFVLSALRTPISTACPVTGIFRDSRADSLAGEVIAALNAQLQQIVGEPSGFPDEVIWGVSRQEGEQGYNLARQAVLEGGLPVHIPALTVCRNCASGLDAILLGQALIESGRCEVLIAGGVEHMGHVPLAENFPGPNFIKQFGVDASRMVACAEYLAKRFGISRVEQDEWAHQSHERALKAELAGTFIPEILPVTGLDSSGMQVLICKDQTIRPNSDLKKLSNLKPFAGVSGSVTAGNSSPVNAGAAGVLIASESWTMRHSAEPLARLVYGAAVGVNPMEMGLGPAIAMRQVLRRANIGVESVSRWEVNEAFAVQVLAVVREAKLNKDRVNPCGGAIALGHALGASGARLVVTLAHALKRNSGRGMVGLCVGGGQGVAALMESNPGNLGVNSN
ncbi:MAG: thiolase family protein [Planctomycetota bacterium]|nr:thiolase family protein [Planctomycetota bacterium]